MKFKNRYIQNNRRNLLLGAGALYLSSCSWFRTNNPKNNLTKTILESAKKQIIPLGRPNRSGQKLKPSHITIHNTSNTTKGADARAHAKFLLNKGFYELGDKENWVSWHFTVDDKNLYQHMPVDEVGVHAGAGNTYSIGIEICMNRGIDQSKANTRAARLATELIDKFELPLSNLVTHQYWTGKSCPTLLLKASEWDKFVGLVSENLPANRKIKKTTPPIIDPDVVEPDLDEKLLRIPEEFLSI